MKLYPALKAIVERDGKFLLLKRSEAEDVRKGEWDIPGGAIEFGEDPIEALRREVKEECG
jgi:8-oxo-dGTP diphosphatase